MAETIKNFTDLDVWKEAHKLVLAVYRMTKNFPKEEQFGLTIQMRRCAVSITSNIAEGFGRATMREKAQFYNISRGSLTELHSQLLVARDLVYIKEEAAAVSLDQISTVGRLLTGIIRSTKARI